MSDRRYESRYCKYYGPYVFDNRLKSVAPFLLQSSADDTANELNEGIGVPRDDYAWEEPPKYLTQ